MRLQPDRLLLSITRIAFHLNLKSDFLLKLLLLWHGFSKNQQMDDFGYHSMPVKDHTSRALETVKLEPDLLRALAKLPFQSDAFFANVLTDPDLRYIRDV